MSRPRTNLAAINTATLIYGGMAFVGLVVAILVGWWIFSESTVMGVRFDRAYYILLITMGLAAALVLFGAMKSTATVQGTQLGISITAGGPAAIFIVIVAGGLWLTQTGQAFAMKVRLDYAGPPVDYSKFMKSLAGCDLTIYAGDLTYHSTTDGDGDASVTGIPASYRDGKLTVRLNSAQLALTDSDASKQWDFPADGTALVLGAVVVEAADQSQKRANLRQSLTTIATGLRRTMAMQGSLLEPAIENFLQTPTAANWQVVTQWVHKEQQQVQAGLQQATSYQAEFGGDLNPDSLVKLNQLPSDPPLADQIGTPIKVWNGKEFVLATAPTAAIPSRDDVLQWQKKLKASYNDLASEFDTLSAELANPTTD